MPSTKTVVPSNTTTKRATKIKAKTQNEQQKDIDNLGRGGGGDDDKQKLIVNANKETTTDGEDNTPATWQFYTASCVLISSMIYLATVILYIRYNLSKSNNLQQAPFWDLVKIPTTVGDAKTIGSLILRYKDDHYYLVFGTYFATYILLQSLCIPGSIVLSILAGYLFPAPLALLVICTCSTLGASTFYIMSYNRGKSLLNLLSSGSDSKVERFNQFVKAKVREYKSNLFICVFILRATPIFPNWTINLCSPIINLPLRPFVLGTFTGVAPLSVIHVWTGRILNDLSNDQSLVNWQSVLMTSLVAISIVFLIYIKRLTKST